MRGAKSVRFPGAFGPGTGVQKNVGEKVVKGLMGLVSTTQSAPDRVSRAMRIPEGKSGEGKGYELGPGGGNADGERTTCLASVLLHPGPVSDDLANDVAPSLLIPSQEECAHLVHLRSHIPTSGARPARTACTRGSGARSRGGLLVVLLVDAAHQLFEDRPLGVVDASDEVRDRVELGGFPGTPSCLLPLPRPFHRTPCRRQEEGVAGGADIETLRVVVGADPLP